MKTKKVKKSYLTSFKADEPTIQELRNIAKNLGIKLKRNMKKKDILKLTLNEIKKIEKSFEIDTQKVEKTTEHSNLQKKDKLKLIPVNPRWVYTYWDFSKKTINKISTKKASKLFLRILESPKTTETTDNYIFEDFVPIESSSEYFLNVPHEDSSYIVQIGTKDENNIFKEILESNSVKTPRSTPMIIDKEKWLIIKGKNNIIEEKESNHIQDIPTKLTEVSSKQMVNNQKLLFPFISDGGSSI